MAAPHVAGAVALLLSFQRALTYAQVYNFLTKSADTSMLEPTEETCSQKGNTGFVYPNNVYGWGRLNVSSAYKLVPKQGKFEKLGQKWNKMLGRSQNK